MKTNQVMIRKMGDFDVSQRTKDGMFNATALLKQWNELVATQNLHTQKSGYVKKDLDDFFSNENTKQFVGALIEEENLNGEGSAYMKSKARADRGGGTWMHPYLFMKFAMWLNHRFEVQVIKFVYDKMLEYRNDSGEDYKALSSAVSKIVPKNDIRNYMKTIAKGINYIIVGRHEQMVRNKFGTEEIQKQYCELEKQVAMLINDGFLKTGEEVVNYLRRKFIKKYF